MLSVASDRPVAPMTLEILILVERVTRELALDYFVIGATARDILLYGVFGFDTGRATRDVDFARVTEPGNIGPAGRIGYSARRCQTGEGP